MEHETSENHQMKPSKGSGKPLIIAHQPSETAGPGKGALDDSVNYPRKSFAVFEWLPSFFPFVIRLYDISIRIARQVALSPAMTEIVAKRTLMVLSKAFLLHFVGPHDPAVQGLIELACPHQPLTDPVVETCAWDFQQTDELCWPPLVGQQSVARLRDRSMSVPCSGVNKINLSSLANRPFPKKSF
jgi:hypothetical protein